MKPLMPPSALLSTFLAADFEIRQVWKAIEGPGWLVGFAHRGDCPGISEGVSCLGPCDGQHIHCRFFETPPDPTSWIPINDVWVPALVLGVFS